MPRGAIRPAISAEHGHRGVAYHEGKSEDKRRLRTIQDGEWSHLLCGDCDGNRLGPLDDYMKSWADSLPPLGELGSLVTCDVNYSKAKLWHLSLLFRSAFRPYRNYLGIDLGPFREPIRQRLLAGDPGTELQFPVWGTRQVLKATGQPFNRFVSLPVSSRVQGHRNYQYAAWGITWTVFVPAQPAEFGGVVMLQESGKQLLDTYAIDDMQNYQRTFKRMVEIDRRRPLKLD